ncbi:MAG: FHA domain-containing protein, partial [Burkholderiales bacterium]
MAAKLILSMDGLVLKEITLTKERTTIGRKPHNDIQIDNLAVSGEHAVIVTILADSFLEDLGSTNGTLVNGQPIKKHFLQNNDVVELGKYKLKYINDQTSKPASPQDFEKTMVLRPGAAPAPPKPPAEGLKPAPSPAAPGMSTSQPSPTVATTQPTPTIPSPQPARAASASQAMPTMGTSQPMSTSQPIASGKVAAIQILSGANAGKEMELMKALTTLGKPGVQVAVITRRPQGYFITHVEGANFPILNGKLLDAQAHSLGDHDIIELAGVKMEFFYKT